MEKASLFEDFFAWRDNFSRGARRTGGKIGLTPGPALDPDRGRQSYFCFVNTKINLDFHKIKVYI